MRRLLEAIAAGVLRYVNRVLAAVIGALPPDLDPDDERRRE